MGLGLGLEPALLEHALGQRGEVGAGRRRRVSLVRASFRLRVRVRLRVTLVIRRSGRVTPVRVGVRV